MNPRQLRSMLVRLAVLPLVLLAACENNIARIWDRDPGGGGDGDATGIVVPAAGGISKEGRPRVVAAFPDGNGWPTTVPVVVVFDESVSPDSVTPAEGSPRVFIRASTGGGTPTIPTDPGQIPTGGTQTAIPADIVYLLGDTVLVLRPLQPLLAQTSYEVVVDPQLSDTDGVTKGGREPEVVASFRPDEDAALEDGEVVTILPLDREQEATRETPVWAIFDRPARADTVTDQTFTVEEAGGVRVSGTVGFPVQLVGVDDTRLARFRLPMGSAFDGGIQHEVRLEDTIAFGDEGTLNAPRGGFVSRFETVFPTSPLAVRVGNPTTGFPDKVNRQNLAGLLVDVEVDAGVTAGMQVIARIYGGEPRTDAEGDLAFVEAGVEVPVDGPTTVSVPFGDRLGTVDALRFEEGDLALTARVEGGGPSGWTLSDPEAGASLDVTPPTVQRFSPGIPGDPASIVTDQEALAAFGIADEPLGAAELTVAGTTVGLFGASDDGGFVFPPVPLGITTQPLGYMLTVTDRAGNVSPDALTGAVTQRGAIRGAFTDTLTIEAYDETTWGPIVGATVVVDPGTPTNPPSSARQVAVTGPDGRAQVVGLSAGPHSVTIVADGYDLVSLLETPAAFCSLPLRPTAGATATLAGEVQFLPAPGRTALVGSNAFADPELIASATTTSAPSAFGPVAVRAGRPQALTAFVGMFEPMTLPTFTSWACLMCGRDGQTPTAPLAPLAPGESVQVPLVALPASGSTLDLAAGYDLDFSASVGLGTPDTPTVRVVAGLGGLAGMSLFGVGFATPTAGEAFRIDASYALPIVVGLAPFGPLLWVSAQTRDGAGNVVRHRRIVINSNLGITFDTVPPPGVPTVEPPAGPAIGAPLVRYADVLDPAALTGGFGVTTITATDANGRSWRLFRQDLDGAGATDEAQFPPLTGVATGLLPGTWNVRAENDLFFTLTQTATGWLIEERTHQQVTWARTVETPVTVQ